MKARLQLVIDSLASFSDGSDGAVVLGVLLGARFVERLETGMCGGIGLSFSPGTDADELSLILDAE